MLSNIAEAELPPQPQPRPSSRKLPRHARDRVVAKVLDFEAARRARGAPSQRRFARETGVPRATLQGWLGSKARLSDAPAVVAFFESPAGLQVLHRLYIALLFVMTLVGAGGTRRVALVLRLAGLDRWIASSEGATKAASTRMERAVGAYGAAERSRLAAEMPSRAISACEDETYHPKPCLVAIEPVSNFILLEQYSQGRDAESWNTALEQAVAGLPVVIEQVTSDEAKGIRAHVRDSLGAQASSDVFHVQHEVSRGTGPCLAAQVRQTQAAVEAAKSNLASVVADAAADDATPRGPGRPKDWTTRQATAQQAVEAAVGADGAAGENREQMRQAIRDIASAYPAFRTFGQ